MERFINKLKNGYGKYFLIIIGLVFFAGIMGIFYTYKHTEEETKQIYVYENDVEKTLAENIGKCLEQYILLENEEKSQIANVAVKVYNMILSSGAEVVTEEHTSAIKNIFLDALNEVVLEKQITAEDMELLVCEMSQFVWSTIKTQLEARALENDANYGEKYKRLSNSLQMQIELLEETIETLKERVI